MLFHRGLYSDNQRSERKALPIRIEVLSKNLKNKFKMQINCKLFKYKVQTINYYFRVSDNKTNFKCKY
jgi:hypothetical protein